MMGAALRTKMARTQWDAEPEFLGVTAAAQMLGVSEASIRRFFTEKKLKRYKIGARSVARRSDVLALAVPEEK